MSKRGGDINIAAWSQFTVVKGGNNPLSTSGHGRKENYHGATVSTAKTTHTLVRMLFKKGIEILFERA